jgi:DNA replication protein DnaC
VEDIDFRSPRGLDRTLLRSLTQNSAWVRQHQNLFLIGPTGIGRSFLACALAEKACRDGFTAFYTRATPLFRDLSLALADGSLRSLLVRLARLDVLAVDDWAMAPLADAGFNPQGREEEKDEAKTAFPLTHAGHFKHHNCASVASLRSRPASPRDH